MRLSGAVIAIVIPLLVVLFRRTHRLYARIGDVLQIGKIPPPPVKRSSLVVVPVNSMSQLTAEAIAAALSLGDDVIAVTVVFPDPWEQEADATFHEQWRQWRPEVPLIRLRTSYRSLAKPLVSYLRSVEAEDRYHRLTVLIPEVHPQHPWRALLYNQRGVILARAIRRGTVNVVICRLRFHARHLAS